MSYSYEWITIRKDGRFALCWLAATNPTAFRNHVKKGHLETMRVSKICDELMNVLNTNTQDPRKRFSLYLAANLAYGTIKIYQKIVNHLLEDVTSSMVVQSFTVTNILQELNSSLQDQRNGRNAKKLRAGPPQKPQKKRPKLMIESLDDFQLENLMSLPQTMLNTSNELITLREVNLERQKEVQESNLNDFGELTTQEATELLDFLETSVQNHRLVGRIQRNRQESNDVSSLDIPLKEVTSEEFSVAGPSRIVTSTPIPHEVPSIPQDVPIEVPENFPPVPVEIPGTPDLPIPPRKKRRKVLQIDQVIFIPHKSFNANMNNYGDTMRCAEPKMDVYHIHQERDPLSKHFRKRKAEPLKELFQRNCKIRCQENAVQVILAEILLDPDPNNNMPEEEVMAPILEDFNQFGRKMPSRKRRAEPMEVAPPPPMEEFQQIPPVVDIEPQIAPRDFQKIPQEHQDDIEDFTKEDTLTKLQKLWKRKQMPITMSVLLQNVASRKIAARAFMSLLELGKIKQVKLHKVEGLEITHISPGSA